MSLLNICMDTAQKRIQALDVMRGTTFAPLKHAAWNGLTPTDLAYPFFIFIMGVALCFSLRKYASSGKGAALQENSVCKALKIKIL